MNRKSSISGQLKRSFSGINLTFKSGAPSEYDPGFIEIESDSEIVLLKPREFFELLKQIEGVMDIVPKTTGKVNVGIVYYKE